jgi:hypothetical protein
MATYDPVSGLGNGPKIGAERRVLQVSDSLGAQTRASDASGWPAREFLKLHHYAQQVRGQLLDKVA